MTPKQAAHLKRKKIKLLKVELLFYQRMRESGFLRCADPKRLPK